MGSTEEKFLAMVVVANRLASVLNECLNYSKQFFIKR